MKFGMLLPTVGPYASGPDALHAQRTLAQQAEALGFDSIWVPDHVVFPKTINSTYPYNDTGRIGTAPILDPLVALSFLAGVTQTIKLGTFVAAPQSDCHRQDVGLPRCVVRRTHHLRGRYRLAGRRNHAARRTVSPPRRAER
ncbi:MAG: LLM class flavin-dependent oxidoreductase [Desulfurellaceae bacterium]|nr:LLM class flavin-dependent oxidoreductase [Desulfurellaceae bacterium]